MSGPNTRVVMTGIGLVSPLGIGTQTNWNALLAGKQGITPIRHFEATDFTSKVAGQVPDFEFSPVITPKDTRRMGRFIQLGLVAAYEAAQQAGIDRLTDAQKERAGVWLGSGIGGLPEIEETHEILTKRGPRRVSPFFIPAILINLFSGQASIKYGLKGPNNASVTACATGAHAIGEATNLIKRGEADIMLAGGAEACVCPTAVAGFSAAKALSTHFNSTPEKASRPFEKNRDGFVISEGASVLVLEAYDHAKKRGADIIAEVIGYGQSGDAYHMTSPDPEGGGAIRAMNAALKNAQLLAEKIGYVNAHATSTPMGDELESKAIERVFGRNVTISATKSMTGHMLGAAGSFEAAVCALALKHQKIPPTINLDEPDPACTLDYTPHTARDVKNLTYAANNSFGFGGTNASLILKKV